MSNFLTDGREALLAALKADAQIDDRVKTYYEFGAGLQQRAAPEPASCPALSLSPSDVRRLPVANVEREIPQSLRIRITTAGQDVEPCEELAALVMACVEKANETAFGLTSEGLTGLRVRSVTWGARPREGAASVLWTATLEVELLWRRR